LAQDLGILSGLYKVFEMQPVDMFAWPTQDSSRNQSDVTRWGILRKFESGRVLVNTKRFLGYDKNKDGELIINEKEAEIVRRVFREYLEGKSYNAILKGLMQDAIKTVTGIQNGGIQP